MYSRWTLPHVRRLFCFYFSTLSSGGALVSARLCRLPEQEVHHPSRNVNYRKEIGALDSFVGYLIALLVHLRQVHPLKETYILMYSRWTSPHVRRLFVSISQRFPRLVHLRQVHPLKAPSAVQSDSLKRNLPSTEQLH
mgnify:FL=1